MNRSMPGPGVKRRPLNPTQTRWLVPALAPLLLIACSTVQERYTHIS